jgi:parallel beta-helix repeat protein
MTVRRLRGGAGIALVAVGLLAPTAAHGQAGGPVLDQSFTSGNNLSAATGGCCNFIAQTFTAGRFGSLAGVNVDTYDANDPPNDDAPLRISIRNTEHGMPGQRVLATTVLDTQNVPLSRLITFPQQPRIHSGVRYAVVINPENPSPSDFVGWAGATGNRYPRGEECASSDDGVSWFCYTHQGFDLHFQTYVNPLPPPPSPNCGDTITTDTTLHRDLVNCPNNGLVIGADGITLDLNGHTIDGDDAPFGGCRPRTDICDAGVLNDGHDRVTVKDGSVSQFDRGVRAGGDDNRLLDLSASGNHFYGLVLFRSAGSVVRNSSAIGSLGRDGAGLVLFHSRDTRVLHNAFRHNARGGLASPKSNHNLIKENLFSRNDAEGFLTEGGKRNRLRGNVFVRNGDGVTLGPGGANNLVRGNRVRAAAVMGSWSTRGTTTACSSAIPLGTTETTVSISEAAQRG